MLKESIKIFFWITILFLIFFGIIALIVYDASQYNFFIHFFSFYILFIYSYTLYTYATKRSEFYNFRNLISIISIVNIFQIIPIKLYYYTVTDTSFYPGAADTMFYDRFSRKLSEMDFIEAIKYFFTIYDLSDLGTILYVRSIYLFIDSPWMIDITNYILGIISAVLIFKISQKVMSNQYSFLCALSFGISSFFITIQANLFKETIFLTLFLLCFHYYIQYLVLKRIKYLLAFVSILMSFLLFRPAIIGLIILSILISQSLQVLKKKSSVLIILAISAIGIVFYSQFVANYENYITGSQRFTDAQTEGISNTSSSTVITVSNYISALFGPLPNFLAIAGTKSILVFYSVGLTFRVLLSIFFFLGVYYVYKIKNYILYPLIVYIFLEMISLTIVLEAFELRKGIFHIPLVFIVSFYYMYKTSVVRTNKSTKRWIMSYPIIMSVLILAWNLRK